MSRAIGVGGILDIRSLATHQDLELSQKHWHDETTTEVNMIFLNMLELIDDAFIVPAEAILFVYLFQQFIGRGSGKSLVEFR